MPGVDYIDYYALVSLVVSFLYYFANKTAVSTSPLVLE